MGMLVINEDTLDVSITKKKKKKILLASYRTVLIETLGATFAVTSLQMSENKGTCVVTLLKFWLSF